MININCDLGEGTNNEEIIMPLISSCNIACGGHAGDFKSMTKCVELSINHKNKIGAHPSFPDKKNFGRKTLKISKDDLSKTIIQQISSLEKIVNKMGSKLYHIKAHGALYNEMYHDRILSEIYLNSISKYKDQCYLYIPFNSELEKLAIEKGYRILYETFGDRNYNDDLTLVSRNFNEAIIDDPKEVINHIKNMIHKNEVKSISGQNHKIKTDTICIHSDTNNSLKILEEINKEFKIQEK